MFTEDNTSGFTVDEIDTLNAALSIRIVRGESEKSASDAITNAWRVGATVKTLIAPRIVR